MYGVEYGRECYCGNTLATRSVKVLESKCQYTCAGNSHESCGGGWHLRLYQLGATDVVDAPAETTFGRQGCYTETCPTRALSEKEYFDDAMTVEKCAAVCAGYTFFGLEYGRECRCGNTFLISSTTVDDCEYSFACPGGSAKTCGATCGAGNRIDLYKFGVKTPSACSTTSSSSVASSTSTSSLSSTASPATLTSSSSNTLSSSTSVLSSPSGSSMISSTSTSSIASSTSSSNSRSSSSTKSSSSSPLTTSSSSSSSSSSKTITTSSSTSSTSSMNPTPTANLLFSANGGNFAGKPLVVTNQYLQWVYNGQTGTPISVILAGGQPFLPTTPTMKLFLHQGSSISGVMYFETAAAAAAVNDPSVTCQFTNGVMTCLSSNGFNTMWVCGGYIYMAKQTWTQMGCTAVTFVLGSS